MNARKVLNAALKLPEADKEKVAEVLLASMDGEPEKDIDAAWAREIERRTREIDRGAVASVSWSKVKRLAARRVRGKA